MNALILQVVDCKYGLHICVVAVLLEVSIEKQRHHAGLPVVAVKNVRLEVHEVTHEVENSSLIEAVTLDIEYILDIDLIKVEIVFVIYEVEDRSVLLELEQTCIE